MVLTTDTMLKNIALKQQTKRLKFDSNIDSAINEDFVVHHSIHQMCNTQCDMHINGYKDK